MHVVLITGLSGSGKDYFAELLEHHTKKLDKKVQILHNADKVKELVQKHFDVTQYKTTIGKNIMMGVTGILYEHDPFYFEKHTDSKVDSDTDLLIIPDWRYKNTHEFFTQHSKSDTTVTTVAIIIRHDEDYKYSIEIQDKEHKLLLDLKPNNYVYNTSHEIMDKVARKMAYCIFVEDEYGVCHG